MLRTYSLPFLGWVYVRTYDPKDAQDVGGKDDQQVDESKQNDCDGDVPGPVKGLVRKHHLLNGSPNLNGTHRTFSTSCNQASVFTSELHLQERAQWAR